MSVLNIRNVPDDLAMKVKMVAVIERKSLREKVIEVLEQAVAGVSLDKVKRSEKKESKPSLLQKYMQGFEYSFFYI